MIRWFFIVFISLSHVNCCAQEARNGFRVISFSVGPSFSNFLSSEAPHKINIPGSDISPGIFTVTDLSQAAGYFDYKPSLIKDVRAGLAIRLGTEFRLNSKWSFYSGIGYEEKGINLKHFSRESQNVNLFDGESSEPTSYLRFHDEYFEVKVKNSYLTLPVLLRKYMAGEKFYVQGGLYAGWLLSSEVYTFQRKHTYFVENNVFESSLQSSNRFKDEEKEFTNPFDAGLSMGCGLNIPLGGGYRSIQIYY